MSSDYEQRARTIVEHAEKLDPQLSVDREEAVKEIAATLPKMEALFGEPGSMKQAAIWELTKAPFTGRIHGVEFERGLWPWGLILLRLTGAVFGPIFGLIQWVGFWNLSRSGHDARLTDEGVEVFSKRKGHIATYSWSAVSQLRRTFAPPITYWELVLSSGDVISLHLAEIEPSSFRAKGIVVDEKETFRSSGDNDG